MRFALQSATRRRVAGLSALCLALALAACEKIPGRPGPGPDVVRPEEVRDFATLFQGNCAGCHGNNGKDGASISLANPSYVEFAQEDIRGVIANGRSGKLMPAFAEKAGGMLTGEQVDILARGIVEQWGNPASLAGAKPPAYEAAAAGDAQRGQQAYATFCARCHGQNGEGGTSSADAGASGSNKLGSIMDPSYLALFSDQYLRSVTVAGRPDQGMPDWRGDAAQPMTDQQVTDIVAWMTSKRVATPGQPYPTRP
jgi:mono/diheme cytochrome c family protein